MKNHKEPKSLRSMITLFVTFTMERNGTMSLRHFNAHTMVKASKVSLHLLPV